MIIPRLSIVDNPVFYALMVGELGSAFKDEGGGVSSWLHQTTNAKLAYYAGWTYWACHITYIASKGSSHSRPPRRPGWTGR